MPIIPLDTYRPALWLRNGHINTFYPYFFRKKIHHNYERERFITEDCDFFDVDWLKKPENKRLAILMHGLEGSSNSQYIMGMTHALHQHDFDVAAINFRSCSGVMNNKPVMYHSGWTMDLDHFITQIQHDYQEINICGFSLGGNVVMKYCGDGIYNLNKKVKTAIGISVPCDLQSGSRKIKELQNHFYENKFLGTLLDKIKQKVIQFPEAINSSDIIRVKTLWDFDEYFTAPIHGFKNAVDYYDRSNSLQFLKNIRIPSLIVNALDDTFLPNSSYPYKEANQNENLFLMTPKYGGHVGFTTFGTSYYWIETVILDFLNKYSDL